MLKGLVVAGTHSGVGKTTVALGLMAALAKRGLVIQPFKVGPDFIDPGHHRLVTGRFSHNLDGFMLSREQNLKLFCYYSQGAHLAVVEGVMGLFDGLGGKSEEGSTAQMAKWLGLPVLLVVDASSMARSVAALVQGFAHFDPKLPLRWVVLNRVSSKKHFSMLKEALEEIPNIKLLGALPREEKIRIPSRHLGLVTSEEFRLDGLWIDFLSQLIEEALELESLLKELNVFFGQRTSFSEDTSDFSEEGTVSAGLHGPRVKIAVARDEAFCFYYEENLRLLEEAGAELVFFSPIKDRHLPKDIGAIYIGGGYPELFAENLAENESLRKEIRHLALYGLPIYAECGGLMYLSKEIEDFSGRAFPMVGVFPFRLRMKKRLSALGYREVRILKDSFFGEAGTILRGHEFHYSEIVGIDSGPEPEKIYLVSRSNREETFFEGYRIKNTLASYIHLHFGSNPKSAYLFVSSAAL